MMSEFMKNLCKIAVPVALQSMLQASFSIIDQLMIGQLGETSISAVGLCGNYSLIFSVLAGAVSTVAGILIAQFIGAREEKEAWCSLTVSVTTALMISFVFLAASGIWPAQILSLYTSDEGILEAGTAYFRILAFSYVPMGLSSVLSAWLRAKNHAVIPFLASLGGVVINTVLNYVLIFGKCGFSALGIRGAAAATLISQAAGCALIFIGFSFCLRKDQEKPVPAFHFTKITARDYGKMILPLLISEFLWSLGQNVESAVYGRLGTDSLAAYTLTYPVQGLMIGALSGLSAAAGVMIGKRLGEKEYELAYLESKKIMAAGLAGAVLTSILLTLLAGRYTQLYRVEENVRVTGKMLLTVFALYTPVKVENMILGGGIMKSGGDTKTIMLIDTIGTWCIGIPLCLLAAGAFHWEITAVYALLTTEEIFRLVITLIIFRKRQWMISLS